MARYLRALPVAPPTNASGNLYAYVADPDATWISLDQNPSPQVIAA